MLPKLSRKAALFTLALWLFGLPDLGWSQTGPTEAPLLPRSDLKAINATKALVSSAHPLATKAGMEILQAGGSATDAAIAVQLVLSLVEPQSSGLGGGSFMLHYEAKTQKVFSYDGRETAPTGVREDLFLSAQGTPLPILEALAGGRPVGIPGFLRQAELAHKKHGKLAWAALFQPAIRLAEQGFAVTPRLNAMLDNAKQIVRDFPEMRAVYLDANGAPLGVGTLLKMPAYARVLREIAQGGADIYYKGPPAQRLIETVAKSPRAPATITLDDMAGYQAVERDPVCAPYRSFKICSMGPPSSGAITVLATLRLLERFDLKALGVNTLASTHVIAQAMALSYADRDRYVADPSFVDVPTQAMLDAAYLTQRGAGISIEAQITAPPSAGTPPGVRQAALSPNNGPDIPGTSHWVVVDEQGNAVSMTGTIQAPFGAFLLVDGYLLNNELTDFAFNPRPNGIASLNRAEPGKRPRSSMSPSFVLDAKGRLVMAIGSAGGSAIIAHTLKTLIGVLDYGLDIQQAIALPNFISMGQNLTLEQDTPLVAHKAALEALGWRVQTRAMVSGLHGLVAKRNPKTGALLGYAGGADPRREGVVLGQ